MNRRDVELFYLDRNDNLIYDKNGIVLDKNQCSEVMKVLKSESNLNQKDIEILRREFSLEVFLKCESYRPKRNRNGEVYFAQLDNGLIKIGCSDNSKDRMKNLKQEFGNMRLLFYINVPDKYYYESLIHFIFKKYNTTRELFDFSTTNVDKLFKELINISQNGFQSDEVVNYMIKNNLDK